MTALRRIHLYLGCMFAPLLTFFAISGIWQTLGLDLANRSGILALLSTIHRSRGLKGPPAGYRFEMLSSTGLRWTVLAMAASLILTIMLGVIMAFRFGRGKIAFLCLAAGFIIPMLLIMAFAH